jgi:hypothetical protein
VAVLKQTPKKKRKKKKKGKNQKGEEVSIDRTKQKQEDINKKI